MLDADDANGNPQLAMTPPPTESPSASAARPVDARSTAARIRASRVALVVGLVLLAAKFIAWRLTDSQTVFSDAMESIVNVVAAVIALFAVAFAAMPADENHPYGHGKIEFVTVGLEGGAILNFEVSRWTL